MSEPDDHEASKRAKNIAAILYLLLMVFLVGGSYLHQHGFWGDTKVSQPG